MPESDGDRMKAPFPWFGGKSRVADLVWQRFGNVPNYVEPFFGSGAVLLSRPHASGTETINDRDCMVANFWRAVQADPDAVAQHADNPVNEADQHARHLWLCSQEDFRERMKTEAEFYDAKIAGWWVWGQCIWIGSGWCSVQLPHLGNAGKGINRQLPHLGNAGTGVHRKRPHLGNARSCISDSIHARISRASSQGARVLRRLVPHLRPFADRQAWHYGCFLDPPYADTAERQDALYATDDLSVAHAVREWAIEWGNDPRMRIALCGYEGEHAMPESWECIPWKARGGYGSQGQGSGRENSAKERIWFSPHCLRTTLFSELMGTAMRDADEFAEQSIERGEV